MSNNQTERKRERNRSKLELKQGCQVCVLWCGWKTRLQVDSGGGESEYHVYSKYRCMWQCVVTRQAELSDRTWCSNAVTLDLPLGIGLSEGLTGLKI